MTLLPKIESTYKQIKSILHKKIKEGFFGLYATSEECGFDDGFHYKLRYSVVWPRQLDYDGYENSFQYLIHLKAKRPSYQNGVCCNEIWQLELYEESISMIQENFMFFFTPHTLSHLESCIQAWLEIPRNLQLYKKEDYYDMIISQHIFNMKEAHWAMFEQNCLRLSCSIFCRLKPDVIEEIKRWVLTIDENLSHDFVPYLKPIVFWRPLLSIKVYKDFFSNNKNS